MAAETNPAAQKLVDSLKALNIGDVDYLYAYLQSVNLSDAEYKGILDNTKQVSQILKGAANPENLPTAQKAEVSVYSLKVLNLHIFKHQSLMVKETQLISQRIKLDLQHL